jgi:hypothetical protein
MKHAMGLVLAFAAGLSCWFLLEIEKGDKTKILTTFVALCIGLLIEGVYLLFLDLAETRKAEKESRCEHKGTVNVLSDIRDRHQELLRKLAEKMERDESLLEVMRNERPGFSAAEMMENWLYQLNRLQGSYWATNYIDSRNIYATEWGKAALLIQNAKKTERTVVIRKVFLVKDYAEMVVLSEHIEAQRNIGVDIHYLRYDQVPALSGDIPSVDFGIFDERVVLVWQLDETRSVTGGKLLFGPEHVDRHKKFFNALFVKAVAHSRDRFDVIKIEPAYLDKMIRTVAAWPPYDAPYEEMSYLLRPPNGWLTVFASRPGCEAYAAYAAGTFVGFSLLVGDGPHDAELYIAIHPRHVNTKEKRFGARLTRETISKGFGELALQRIHLKVRNDVQHRVLMYEHLHFRRFGTIHSEVVNGINTEFIRMEMERADFQKLTDRA